MADIRIKDLATLESASLTGDVFVIDGTTGTRKLSAFSPTFGGNVVVTGTLTTNGNVTINSNVGIIGKSGTGTGGNWRFVSDDGTSRWLTGLLGGSGETSYSIYDSANSRSLLTATAAGVVQINQTTASTTTSTGALVVSGGVGVAGNINGGGAILAQGALSSIPAVNYLSTELSSGQGYITCYNGSGSAYLALNYRASQHNFTSNGAVAVQSTTASTTTSSGALVVSGGVGVAGAVNAGTFYGLVDGVTAPATESGYARIYVDSADGDLKVKFGDGTVKTIATDS